MRWTLTSGPTIGHSRIKSRFLLFPKCIKGDVRWMERCTWVEEYSVVERVVPDIGIREFAAWVPIKWVTNNVA